MFFLGAFHIVGTAVHELFFAVAACGDARAGHAFADQVVHGAVRARFAEHAVVQVGGAAVGVRAELEAQLRIVQEEARDLVQFHGRIGAYVPAVVVVIDVLDHDRFVDHHLLQAELLVVGAAGALAHGAYVAALGEHAVLAALHAVFATGQ